MSVTMMRPQAPVEREGWDDFLAYTKFFGSTACPEEIAAYERVINEYRALYGVYDTYEQALQYRDQCLTERDVAERARVAAEVIKNSMANERDKLLSAGQQDLQAEREQIQAGLDGIRAAAVALQAEAEASMQAYIDFHQEKQRELLAFENAVEKRSKELRDAEDALKTRKEKVYARETQVKEVVERLLKELG